jgi:putative transposase
MTNEYPWRTGRSCIIDMPVHLVFFTKFLKGVFSEAMLSRLFFLVEETCKQMDVHFFSCSGEVDYLHIKLSCPSKIAMSNLVGKLKGKTAYYLRKEFAEELEGKLWGAHLWSPSYCLVAEGEQSVGKVNEFIEKQRTPALPRYAEHSVVMSGDRHPKRIAALNKK